MEKVKKFLFWKKGLPLTILTAAVLFWVVAPIINAFSGK